MNFRQIRLAKDEICLAGSQVFCKTKRLETRILPSSTLSCSRGIFIKTACPLNMRRQTVYMDGSGNFQRNLHHVGEGVRPVLSGQGFTGHQAVGDGQQRQRVLPRGGGVQIQRVGLHLYA